MTREKLPEIRYRKLSKEIERMSDEEYFTRPSFEEYLNHILNAICSASKGKLIRLKVISMEEGTAGWSTEDTVSVNVSGRFMKCLPDRESKFFAIVGILVHECGHILFSDFKETESYLDSIRKGVCPGSPYITEHIKGKSAYFLKFLSDWLGRWDNIIDDDFIEHRLLETFKGLPKPCLEAVRECIFKEGISVMKESFESRSDIVCLSDMCLLQVQKKRSVNRIKKLFPEKYERLEADYLKILGIMKSVSENGYSAGYRRELFNSIAEILLPYIEKEWNEAVEKKMKDSAEDTEGPADTCPEEKRTAGNDEPGGKEGKTMDSGIPESGDTENCNPGEDKPCGVIREVPEGEILAELEKEMAGSETDILIKPEDQERTFSSGNTDKGKKEVSPDLPDFNSYGEAARAELEDEAVRREEAEMPEYSLEVLRKVNITPEMVSLYRECRREAEPVARRTVRMLENALKDRQIEGRLSGQLYGKRLDMRQAYRTDGRLFIKEMVPDGAPKAAFCVLVDESGSMCGCAIKAARSAAITLEQVLREMDVPRAVVGHTANESGHKDITIRKYVSFDDYDKRDCFRLSDIRNRDNNHDAAAIRYCGNLLDKRSEPLKVLIIISDGQPAAYGFSGCTACRKTADTVAELEKEGIKVFAAALSGSYKSILSIYGKERLLDIRNPENLPRELTRIVKKYCLKRMA